jgi:hypothetical protein
MRSSLLMIAAAAAGLMLVPTARATLIYYDSFDYTAQNPGSGFSTSTTLGQNEPWNPGRSGLPVSNWDLYQNGSSSPYVGTGSLSYAGLAVDPNPNSNNASYRGDGFGNHSGDDYRWFGQPATYNGAGPPFTTYSDPVSGTTTLYYSLLMRVTDMGTLTVGGSFPDGQFMTAFMNTTGDGTQTAQGNTAGALMFMPTGDSASSTTYQLGIGSTVNAGTHFSPTTYNLNQTLLVVVAYTMNAGSNDNVAKLYIDPTPGSLESGNTPVATETSLPSLTLTGFVLKDDAHLPDGLAIDELRIGTTWADVTPASVPLPASVLEGLLLVGGLAGKRLLRRR